MINLFRILVFLFIVSCNNNNELALERGNQYYEWKQYDKAILEYKQIIHNIENNNNLSPNNIKILSQAYYNLGLAYSKNDWFEYAIKEIKISFDLYPTENKKKVLSRLEELLIKSKKESINP
tara:strand:+ start:182 stop:547 length:366 start_codon:yes stop_codon:yes gene_type:complete